MDREEILKIAADSGIDCDDDGDIWGSTNGALLAFANAIAAHEREEIADMVGKKLEGTVMSKYAKAEDCKSHRMLLAECIAAIRSRGNK